MTNQFQARREQMLHDLALDLAEMVRTGDMTDTQANEWLASKADQWSENWFN